MLAEPSDRVRTPPTFLSFLSFLTFLTFLTFLSLLSCPRFRYFFSVCLATASARAFTASASPR